MTYYSKIKVQCCYAIILSVSSFVISLLLMFPCLPRILSNQELQFDYIGAIIGVLSLIVTLLLGWNIWSLIDMNTMQEKIELKIKHETKNMYNDVFDALATYTDIENINFDMIENNVDEAIELIFIYLKKSINKPFNETTIKAAMSKLKLCMILNKKDLYVLKNKKEEYLEILSVVKWNNNNKQPIIDAIRNAKESPNLKDIIKNYQK